MIELEINEAYSIKGFRIFYDSKTRALEIFTPNSSINILPAADNFITIKKNKKKQKND